MIDWVQWHFQHNETYIVPIKKL